MPHIQIQCYPKALSEQELQQFAEELSQFISQKLKTDQDFISIDYQELDPETFKKMVWDKHIVPRRAQLIRQPNYEL